MAISTTAYTSLAVQIVKKLDDNILETETVIDTLLRLLGLSETSLTKQNFVTFLRRKDKTSIETKIEFSKYLNALKGRLSKWTKDANTVRINKIKRLLGDNGDVPQVDIKPEDSLEVALQKIQKFRKQLDEKQDQYGLLNTEYAFYQAALDKMDNVIAAMPTNDLGVFGPELIGTMRADASVLKNTTDRFKRQKMILETELIRLQKDEEYLMTGADLSKAEGQKISLSTVVDTCLYLTEKIGYQCKECIYFSSSNSLCLYGGNNLATKLTNSCADVYKKSDNPFWRANTDTIVRAKNGTTTATATITSVSVATTTTVTTTSSTSSSVATPATTVTGTSSPAPIEIQTAAGPVQTVATPAAPVTQTKTVLPSQQVDEAKVQQRAAEILREQAAKGPIKDPASAKFRATNQARSEQIRELKKQNPNWGT